MADPLALGQGTVARSSPRTSRASSLRALNPPDLVAVPFAFVIGALACLSRCPSTILHPELWAEDGAVWFKNAYEQGWWFPLSHPYTGYLQTFPRLISDVGLLVPLRRLPLLFVLVSLAVQVLPAVVIVSRRYAGIIPNFGTRLVLGALYLAVPNAAEINVNLTNAQWHLGLLAVLVVLADPPQRRAWKVFDLAAIVTSGLTGPFTLALLPVAFLVWFRRRSGWSARTLLVVAGLCLIQVLELTLTSQESRHLGPLGITAHRLIEIVGGQIVGASILGSSSLMSPATPHAYFVESICFMLGGAALLAVVLWRAPFELKLFNLFVGLISIAFLASPVVAVSGSQWQVLATNYNLRYWFFPALAVLVDLVWMAGQVRIGRGIVAAVGALALAAALVVGVRIDYRYPPLPKPDWAAEVAAFNTAPRGTVFQFTIDPPGFPMTLVKK